MTHFPKPGMLLHVRTHPFAVSPKPLGRSSSNLASHVPGAAPTSRLAASSGSVRPPTARRRPSDGLDSATTIDGPWSGPSVRRRGRTRRSARPHTHSMTGGVRPVAADACKPDQPSERLCTGRHAFRQSRCVPLAVPGWILNATFPGVLPENEYCHCDGPHCLLSCVDPCGKNPS